MLTRLNAEELSERIKSIKQKISKLASDSLNDGLKPYYLMGIITPLLDDLGADPAVIVGGHAVELYTSGSYKTVDIDIVMIRDDLARDLFDRLGFERKGRFHYVSELDIPIEFPSNDLAGSKERVTKLNTPEGYCYVIGVEDLILDRLRAAEFWKDTRSEEWARYLISSQIESLDIDYMRKLASEESTSLLNRLEKEYAWVNDNLNI